MNPIYADRQELKYQINSLDRSVLAGRLDRVLKRDCFCKESEYKVTSLYFDDPYNSALSQKINGDAQRHKYRIRFYNEDTVLLKLERKTKIHQMTKKISIGLLNEDCSRILSGNFSFLSEKEGDIFQDFHRELTCSKLKPKVIVQYQRLSFVHPVGNLRITFDSDIRTSGNQLDLFNKSIMYTPVLGIDDVIMEIKFTGIIPDYIRNLIQTRHVMAGPSSKYVFSRKYNYEL